MVVRFGPGVELGWVVAAVGAGMDVIGWYQISGQPTEAQQLPYLASATIPGAALIVAGAVLIAARRATRPEAPRGGREGIAYPDLSGGLWAVPDGSYLHRAQCPLLDGKPEAFEVAAGANGPGPARACPICDPDLVAAP